MGNRFFCLMAAAALAAALPAFALRAMARQAAAQNQEFDLLIRSGHVIDPRNAINAVMDVAVTGNKIALVAATSHPRERGKSLTPRASTLRPV